MIRGDKILCDKVCQWLAIGRLFSPRYSGFSHQQNRLPQYNWNFVESESGIKHHKLTYQIKSGESLQFLQYSSFLHKLNLNITIHVNIK